jgi:hypothetical protein
MKKKILAGLLILAIVLGITFAVMALTEENRLWAIGKFGEIEQLAYEGGQILSVPDTIVIIVIGQDVKIPLPEAYKTQRNTAAVNKLLQIEEIVDSMKVRFGL